MPSLSANSKAVTAINNEPAKTTTLSERLQKILDDKRGMQNAVPIDLSRYLNESQLLALHSLEGFGWQLSFVRRPAFNPTTVVVSNSETHQYAVLEADGSVNLKPTIELRHDIAVM